MKFTQRTEIDEYIVNNELNASIYQVLLHLQDNNDNNRYHLKRCPLAIFNQAYSICEQVKSIKHPENEVNTIYAAVRDHFLAYETTIIFSCVYLILSFTEKENSNMRFFLNRIKQKLDSKYFCEFEPLLNEEHILMGELPLSFKDLKIIAENNPNLNEKELFYTDYLTRYKQAKNKGNIIQQIEDEIALIKKKKELANPIEKEETKFQDTQNTASLKVRSVVILELLRAMKCGKANNDLSNICRLIAFLTGNSYNSIYNDLQKGVILKGIHSKDIQEANQLLSSLNISISIEKDNQY